MPRAIWSGTISFGLVNVPVGLYSAVEQKTIHFHEMTKSGHRVRHKRVDAKTGREVDYDDLMKGYEVSRNKVVMIEPEDLEAAAPHQTHTIDIEDFVELADIDPIYYNSTYYLAPRNGTGSEKAYALLRDAMRKSGRAAVGRFVMRSRQYLAVIRPSDDRDGALMLETLYFADEIRAAKDLDVPKRVKVGARQLNVAQQLIDNLTTDWDPKRYKDTYRAAVEKVIDKKAKGRPITVEEEPEPKAEVVDLVEALRASLDQRKRPAKRKSSSRKRKAS